jgi:flagellar hook-basal body complex protein FliE
MSTFDDFISDVVSGAKGFASQNLKGFVEQAEGDSRDFLAKSRDELQKWTTQLAKGQITKEMFENLVQGEKDLAEMHALTEAAVSLATLQRFRDKLIDLVIDAAFKRFLPI